MATDVSVPALGESITEGTLAQWLKKPGEAVAADEPIASLDPHNAHLVMAALLYVIPERQLWVVSIFGAMAHNLGQLLTARFVAGIAAIWYYLPVLLLSALITGLVTGLCAQLVLKRLRCGAERKKKGEST